MPIRPVRRESADPYAHVTARPRTPPPPANDAGAPTVAPRDERKGKVRLKRLKGGGVKREPTGDYLVGNCRTPEHSRFKAGNPGGPGRPRKSRNHDTIVKEQLEEKRTLTIDGKVKSLSQREILLKMLMKAAMGGDLRAIKMLLDEAARLYPEPSPPAQAGDSAGEDAAIVDAFIASLTIGEPAESGEVGATTAGEDGDAWKDDDDQHG